MSQAITPTDPPSTDVGRAPGAADVAAPAWVWADFGARTHPGLVRERNEDHFLVARMAKVMRVVETSLPRPRDGRLRVSSALGALMVVADGMGGAAAGERASALAVSGVEGLVLDSLKWFLHLPGAEEHTLVREFRAGLKAVDRALFDEADADPSLTGMGTTLTIAFSVGADLFIVHVGDSRAYLYRGGQLDRLTTDHTVAQMLVDTGLMTPEAARRDRRRHVITNVIGGPTVGVSAEIHKVRLEDGDAVLLCTDGLTDPVGDDEIAEVLARHDDPEQACAALVERALGRGGPDNVTAALARFAVDDVPPEGQLLRLERRTAAAGLFLKLAECLDRGDGRRAAEAQRALRKLGWSVDNPLAQDEDEPGP